MGRDHRRRRPTRPGPAPDRGPAPGPRPGPGAPSSHCPGPRPTPGRRPLHRGPSSSASSTGLALGRVPGPGLAPGRFSRVGPGAALPAGASVRPAGGDPAPWPLVPRGSPPAVSPGRGRRPAASPVPGRAWCRVARRVSVRPAGDDPRPPTAFPRRARPQPRPRAGAGARLLPLWRAWCRVARSVRVTRRVSVRPAGGDPAPWPLYPRGSPPAVSPCRGWRTAAHPGRAPPPSAPGRPGAVA
ncbi:hypothetical protein SAMN02745830_06586 [Streptomyces sp. Amel2xC10]|nr:hypothetical protein SAMN02745830_06586 [Streptomyces sp. Amel2xC10]